MKNEFVIRSAGMQDVGTVHNFIRELAEYEKLSHEVSATPDLLTENIFVRNYAEVIIGELDSLPIGFALFFHNFSTFLAKPGIFLEDLYVREAYRGRGFGKKLLSHLAALAVERGCGRLEWSVLDWNKPAIDFYLSLGARPMDEWTVFRLTGESLEGLSLLA
jgi:GNAT superfamily N-acetyltransferase